MLRLFEKAFFYGTTAAVFTHRHIKRSVWDRRWCHSQICSCPSSLRVYIFLTLSSSLSATSIHTRWFSESMPCCLTFLSNSITATTATQKNKFTMPASSGIHRILYRLLVLQRTWGPGGNSELSDDKCEKSSRNQMLKMSITSQTTFPSLFFLSSMCHVIFRDSYNLFHRFFFSPSLFPFH